MTDDTEFDGLAFMPDKTGGFDVTYFKLKDDFSDGVIRSRLGIMYHIVFFKNDEKGYPQIDDEFEAIFSDPFEYIKNLRGSNWYGVMLKKTKNSTEWFKNYVTLILANMNEYKKSLEVIQNGK